MMPVVGGLRVTDGNAIGRLGLTVVLQRQDDYLEHDIAVAARAPIRLCWSKRVAVHIQSIS